MRIVSRGLLLVLFFTATCYAQVARERQADVSQPLADPAWIRRVGEQQFLLTNHKCDVCFIGDSLTEYWQSTGKDAWDREFAPCRLINLGLAGDRTEQVLNRISRFDFHRANPRVFVLLMGTNNLGMTPPDRPEEVVKALLKAEVLLRAKVPSARIVVIGLPPSGKEDEAALVASIKKTNQLLSVAAWSGEVTFLPVFAQFVDEKDHWRTWLTLDNTHFSALGYRHFATLLKPVIEAEVARQRKANPQ